MRGGNSHEVVEDAWKTAIKRPTGTLTACTSRWPARSTRRLRPRLKAWVVTTDPCAAGCGASEPRRARPRRRMTGPSRPECRDSRWCSGWLHVRSAVQNECRIPGLRAWSCCQLHVCRQSVRRRLLGTAGANADRGGRGLRVSEDIVVRSSCAPPAQDPSRERVPPDLARTTASEDPVCCGQGR